MKLADKEEVKQEINQNEAPVSESSSQSTSASNNYSNNSYEFNSYWDDMSFSRGGYWGFDLFSLYKPEQIKAILKDPIHNHNAARELAMYVYNTEGVVTNAIDYMVALPCLDRVVYAKKRTFSPNKLREKNRITKNKDLMLSALEQINDKQFIRDALFTDMNEGNSFFYLETTAKPGDYKRFMSDYDVENIVELNDVGLNAVMMPLPYQYSKIVGRKNGRYVMAFNLRYFDEEASEELRERKLKKMPLEISRAYQEWVKGQRQSDSWVVLDNNHTICHKIKSKISEPWGRPLAIAAIPDILYQNEFVDTKRNILREINSQVIVQTFPEGKDKGSCALTKAQQEDQHNKVKNAVMTKNNREGSTFVSVAAGTKLDRMDIANTDLFDEKNESDLTDKIALDLGIAASLLNGSGSGNYSSQQNNLELINAQIFSWVSELQEELNYVINACIIKDRKYSVQVYYLPTSLVNRQKFFDMMKSMYLEAGGSYTYLIASSGLNPDAYFNVLDEEVDNRIFDRYEPHQTAYTQSGKIKDSDATKPTLDNPTNPSTIQTRANNSNNQPKPSDNG